MIHTAPDTLIARRGVSISLQAARATSHRVIKRRLDLSRTIVSLIMASALCSMGSAWANDTNSNPSAELSLEDLLKVEVTTASRKSQLLTATAAAVYVITRDDIARAGATNIPELLRLAPGVNVGQLASDRYAVSVRGANSRFANKLLVLIDGRSIYSPLFSGVMWEFENTFIDDIERIEIIRGPGSSLWGANAVNAVINIITRKARTTDGKLLMAGTGTAERGMAGFRFGESAEEASYRLWAQTKSLASSVDQSGNSASDAARMTQFGFRRDSAQPSGTRFTWSGSIFDQTGGDRRSVPSVDRPTASDIDTRGRGGHLLGRAEWAITESTEAALQASINRTHLDAYSQLNEYRTTTDVDFQHRLITTSHDLIWGLSYRHSADRTTSLGIFELKPASSSFIQKSGFVHVESTIVPNRLQMIAGLRIEHNTFTGYEPQPNVRLIFMPNQNHSLWGALSRSVSTPSRGDRDGEANLLLLPATGNSPDILLRRTITGAARTESERISTVELGYRGRFSPTFNIDIAAFRATSPNIRATNTGSRQLINASPRPYVLQEVVGNNAIRSDTRGVEILADWQVVPWWRLQSAYSYLEANAEAKDNDPMSRTRADALVRSTPRHQASIQSSMTPRKSHMVDFALRYVGELSGSSPSQTVPAYTELSVRYAWQGYRGIELSIGGQNLLKHSHLEFVPDLLPSEPVKIRRNVYIRAKWHF